MRLLRIEQAVFLAYELLRSICNGAQVTLHPIRFSSRYAQCSDSFFTTKKKANLMTGPQSGLCRSFMPGYPESPKETSFKNPVRSNNEPFRCGAHKIEGITSHQGQNCTIRIVQYFRVLGLDHFEIVHPISVRPAQSRQPDFIILTDITQRSEKCIPVSCDHDVPLLARQRGAWNMPGRSTQSPFESPGQIPVADPPQIALLAKTDPDSLACHRL